MISSEKSRLCVIVTQICESGLRPDRPVLVDPPLLLWGLRSDKHVVYVYDDKNSVFALHDDFDILDFMNERFSAIRLEAAFRLLFRGR